jgi:hypothetical protein
MLRACWCWWGAGLDIFVDDEFRAGGAPPPQQPGGPPAAEPGAGSGWAQLGSFEQTRKENQQQAGQWAGVLALPEPNAACMPAQSSHILVLRLRATRTLSWLLA